MVLRAHFLNVGHGDCTMLELPSGRIMMVDINNSKALPDSDIDALAEAVNLSVWEFKSATRSTPAGLRDWESYYKSLLVDPYDYYKDNFSEKTIFRYIQTHPDMDHMSGLYNFFYHKAVPLENFWDTEHGKELNEEDFKNSPYEYLDWLTYTILRGGKGPNSSEHKVLHIKAGDVNSYWLEDGIEILGPNATTISDCVERGKYNDISYVLRISNGGRSIILPGDAESRAWRAILADFGAEGVGCDVLKASHHGRESGYDEEAVSTMNPSAVICSVGKKPSTDASDEYSSHGASVFSTRYHGTITVTIWNDGELWIDNQKGDRLFAMSSKK